MAQPHYVLETTILQKTVLQKTARHPKCRWQFTKHSLEEMEADNVTAPDIKHALMNGQVALEETAKRDILWRVVGNDLDGHRIQVVVAVFEQIIKIKVITTF